MSSNNHIKWKPVVNQIMTRWGKKISPDNPLPEYPRPQLKRNDWVNLNGLWDYAIRPKKYKSVNSFDGKLLVPFPVESSLSGVKRKVTPKQKLWYRRIITVPKSWKGRRIMINFGAVDWETTIWVNGKEIGSHKGGYTPFSFEITDSIDIEGENELLISVWDPTNKGGQERGKQTLRPYGIYYTAITGIWQTVWLEPVPVTYIDSIKVTPDIDNEIIKIRANIQYSQKGEKISVIVKEGKKDVIEATEDAEEQMNIKITSPKLWSPDNPFLYDIDIQLKRGSKILDEVSSYFGMRKIALGVDEKGNRTIELNNQPMFLYGTLDQGFWPDGLYTAPADEALRYDIEITKELGFNAIRKHVKVEPARWYYHCDKIGMLVWQDMPNAGKTGLIHMLLNMLKNSEKYEGKRKESEKRDYYNELESMIISLFNHPSIVVWIPFNEGWGQFETEKVVEKVRELDPYRLIDNASGWHDKGVGDICDCHKYPGPKLPEKIRDRAAVCGEFGGLGLKVENHMWDKKIRWAYKKFPDSEELTKKYDELISKLIELKNNGLIAAIYTQTTDVEGEINGLLTYDREMIKMDKKRLREMNLSLHSS
jgi:beta-galactosidase/beta-glucuronidase